MNIDKKIKLPFIVDFGLVNNFKSSETNKKEYLYLFAVQKNLNLDNFLTVN